MDLCAFVLLQIDAFQHMQHFVQTMQQQAQHAIATEDQQHKQELHKLMARCFLKLGEWQLNLQGINESTIPKVLQYYSAATEHDRSWYKVRKGQCWPQTLASLQRACTLFEFSHVPMVTARSLECLSLSEAQETWLFL